MIGSTFGDMLIQLGKIAIEAGVGIKAIRKTFESMNPYVAIAAGVALVAFGTMIKSSVSKIGTSGGSGGYSASGSGQGFGNGFSSAAVNTQQNPMVITLTGQLVAKGSDLVYVVEQESRRRRVAT